MSKISAIVEVAWFTRRFYLHSEFFDRKMETYGPEVYSAS